MKKPQWWQISIIIARFCENVTTKLADSSACRFLGNIIIRDYFQKCTSPSSLTKANYSSLRSRGSSAFPARKLIDGNLVARKIPRAKSPPAIVRCSSSTAKYFVTNIGQRCSFEDFTAILAEYLHPKPGKMHHRPRYFPCHRHRPLFRKVARVLFQFSSSPSLALLCTVRVKRKPTRCWWKCYARRAKSIAILLALVTFLSQERNAIPECAGKNVS